MFVVMYDLRGMPANHQTFLRQRTFSVPVKQEMKRSINKDNVQHTAQLLRYLIHLRFQSSKSGKIYLHRDVRLLFSRKSMEVDSGAAYELKSYTESPTNPQFSPRCWWGGGATKSICSAPKLEREHLQNGVHQIRARRVALLRCPWPDLIKGPLKWDPLLQVDWKHLCLHPFHTVETTSLDSCNSKIPS